MKCMEEYEYMILIIASYLANYEVNSTYCNCKVVNHEKRAKQFFSQGKFNSSTLYFSTLYPNYIHILLIHYILLSKKNIVYTQNYIAKRKKCFSVFLKKLSPVVG